MDGHSDNSAAGPRWHGTTIIGVRKNGLRYFKLATVPSGVPWFILPIVIPIEIISNFLVRPVTHSLTCFAMRCHA